MMLYSSSGDAADGPFNGEVEGWVLAHVISPSGFAGLFPASVGVTQHLDEFDTFDKEI